MSSLLQGHCPIEISAAFVRDKTRRLTFKPLTWPSRPCLLRLPPPLHALGALAPGLLAPPPHPPRLPFSPCACQSHACLRTFALAIASLPRPFTGLPLLTTRVSANASSSETPSLNTDRIYKVATPPGQVPAISCYLVPWLSFTSFAASVITLFILLFYTRLLPVSAA